MATRRRRGHAAARRARARQVHPAAPARPPRRRAATGRPASPRRVDVRVGGLASSSADDEHAGLGLRDRAREPAGRRAARPPHPDQRRARTTTRSTGLEVVLPGARPPDRGPGLHRPARARATPQRHDGHRRAVAARGPRRPARARTPPPWAWSARRASRTTHGEVLGVHVGWSGNSVLRVERDAATGTTIGGGELLQPGEVVWRRARPTRRRGSTSPRRTTASTGWPRPGTPGSARLPSPPRTPAGRAQRLGGGLLRPRPGPAARRSPTGRPGSGSSGSCSTTAGSGTAATTPPASATGGSTRRSGRTASTRWSTTSAGSGMEFGLWFEPEMVNPDSDLFRAHPDWVLADGRPGAAAGAPPAGARPDPPRGARPPVRRRSARCSTRTRSTT